LNPEIPGSVDPRNLGKLVSKNKTYLNNFKKTEILTLSKAYGLKVKSNETKLDIDIMKAIFYRK